MRKRVRSKVFAPGNSLDDTIVRRSSLFVTIMRRGTSANHRTQNVSVWHRKFLLARL